MRINKTINFDIDLESIEDDIKKIYFQLLEEKVSEIINSKLSENEDDLLDKTIKARIDDLTGRRIDKFYDKAAARIDENAKKMLESYKVSNEIRKYIKQTVKNYLDKKTTNEWKLELLQSLSRDTTNEIAKEGVELD